MYTRVALEHRKESCGEGCGEARRGVSQVVSYFGQTPPESFLTLARVGFQGVPDSQHRLPVSLFKTRLYAGVPGRQGAPNLVGRASHEASASRRPAIATGSNIKPRGALCALLVVCLLTAPPLPAARARGAQPSVIGTIVQAERAQLGAAPASRGATIYDGDALGTDDDGTMRLRAGAALVYLGGNSGAKLRRTATGFQTELIAGTAVFSTAQVTAMEFLAEGALIRPSADGPTVAQVTVAGPKELDVIARRGALQFTYGGESEMIPEGASYRVMLDPPEAVAASLASREGTNPNPPRRAGRSRRAFLFLLGGGAGGVAVWIIHEAIGSPDKP
jgi:hypothetical protein